MFTLDAACSARLEIKGSEFLAELVPFVSFDETLARLRARHSRATHHCTAARWINETGQLSELARDDGEPGGTAGRPMLRVLQGREMINVGAVVVRYYGGVKLGTGGLARAYGNAVAEALAEAHIVPWVEIVETTFDVGFERIEIMERAVREHGLEVRARDFSQNGVSVTVAGAEQAITDARAVIFPY